MNKKLFLTATIISLAMTTPVWATEQTAESSSQNYRIVCERYAEEDEVTADKMAGYMALCLEEIKNQLANEVNMDSPADADMDTVEPGEDATVDLSKGIDER